MQKQIDYLIKNNDKLSTDNLKIISQLQERILYERKYIKSLWIIERKRKLSRR